MKRKQLEEIIFITERWKMYLEGGYTLSRAIDYCLDDMKFSSNQNCLEYMLLDLENGIGAEFAIDRCKNFFPDFYIHMFKLAVKTGKLVEVLYLLQEYYQKREDYYKEIEHKLYYPIITFTVFLGICFTTTVVFLPRMMAIYNQMELELPWLTRQFIVITNILFQPLTLAIILLGGIGLGLYLKSLSSRPEIDKILLEKIPVVRKLFLYKTLRNFLLALKISLSAGGEITESLKYSAEICGSSYFKSRIKEVIVDINIGKPLSKSLIRWLIIPQNLQPVIKSGEDTGNIIESLDFCSEFCHNREEEFLQKFSINLEPVIILVLTVLVTILALALLMPLWDLYGSIIQF